MNQSGEWIDVDITWDPPLKPFGFKTFPEDWDGQTSFIGVMTIERWDGVNIKQKKERAHRKPFRWTNGC